jgi:hypothetical protein
VHGPPSPPYTGFAPFGPANGDHFVADVEVRAKLLQVFQKRLQSLEEQVVSAFAGVKIAFSLTPEDDVGATCGMVELDIDGNPPKQSASHDSRTYFETFPCEYFLHNAGRTGPLERWLYLDDRGPLLGFTGIFIRWRDWSPQPFQSTPTVFSSETRPSYGTARFVLWRTTPPGTNIKSVLTVERRCLSLCGKFCPDPGVMADLDGFYRWPLLLHRLALQKAHSAPRLVFLNGPYEAEIPLLNLPPHSQPPEFAVNNGVPLTICFAGDGVSDSGDNNPSVVPSDLSTLTLYALDELRRRVLQDEAPPGNRQSLPAATANAERDEWLYDQCCALVKYEAIIGQLRKRTEWEPIDSPQGIKNAANRHAERNGLPAIPSRQPGRPPAEK